MLHGSEPRGAKARYWVRFFMTRMASRELGLRTAMCEICAHSTTRCVYVYLCEGLCVFACAILLFCILDSIYRLTE